MVNTTSLFTVFMLNSYHAKLSIQLRQRSLGISETYFQVVTIFSVDSVWGVVVTSGDMS